MSAEVEFMRAGLLLLGKIKGVGDIAAVFASGPGDDGIFLVVLSEFMRCEMRW
jgi:hypothetical protein